MIQSSGMLRGSFVVLFLACMLLPVGTAASEGPDSPLTLSSSDAQLVTCFDWAKGQALHYVRAGDPVGLWYEAALPGREAFCMRDVSHQAAGAHALGLAAHTRNMLRKFAVNISESKDWCSYWEINRYDKPAPVDYTSDKEFWYNLPANFDVLDACYRMYLWTHDRTYLEDPAFVAFYEHTLTDYVERWALGLDKVLERARFMNRDSFDRRKSHQSCRGIPSYHEGTPGQTRLGIDLLAFQAAACRSYGLMLRSRGDDAGAVVYLMRAVEIMRFIEEHFWNETERCFNELLLTDGRHVVGGGMRVYALYADALRSPEKIERTLQSLIEGQRINIELGSHYPEVFYRYGAHEEAYRWLLQLSDPGTRRREYPEVSFAVIGAIVGGLMGIEPLNAEGRLWTLARLTDATAWAKISNLPVHGNVIDVRHNGAKETVLTNRAGTTVTWFARFYGSSGRLTLDGTPVETHRSTDHMGRPLILTQVSVPAGQTRTVTCAPAN
ncbi:MAG: hypothetical protein JSW27_13455 [Phycisphaerales bacterium]|nr:MAG: hypothetical protein JSW27_13455 [Phycisphaerales bacterium]